jgi:hypothetical protein
MKSKITLLRGNVAPPVRQKARATNVLYNPSDERPMAVLCRQTRPKLKLIWRTNPANCRLECHWVVEGEAATDEGVSCGQLSRRAA